ncbi:MAG: DnaD domain protein [Lachnospiraceae bacterium]|nr:DnaD domain protein [Lachnospiraceae bacterium]
MKKLNLRSKNSGSYFELPVEFVDRYLAEASELSLKVYLYLLRSAQDPSILLSVSDMADFFDATPNKVTLALRYWAEKGLLSLEFVNGELSDITLLPMPSEQKTASAGTPVSLETAPAPASKQAATAPRQKATLHQAEEPVFDLSRLLQDEGFSDILSLAEYYLKKPVTSTMRDALGTVYLMLGRKADVVEYLLEYCIDGGHTSPQYLKAVAAGWKEEGLLSVEAIRARNASRNRFVYSVMSEFGIRNREPVAAETEYILSWAKDFELPVVREACRRTMANLHAPDFKYANGILTRWKNAGVSTIEEIAVLDRDHAAKKKTAEERPAVKKTSFHNFPERHTDYDAMFAELQKTRGVV